MRLDSALEFLRDTLVPEGAEPVVSKRVSGVVHVAHVADPGFTVTQWFPLQEIPRC